MLMGTYSPSYLSYDSEASYMPDAYSYMTTTYSPLTCYVDNYNVYLGYLAYMGNSAYSAYLSFYFDYAYAYYGTAYTPDIVYVPNDTHDYPTTTTLPPDYDLYVTIDALDKVIPIGYIRQYDIRDIYLSKEFEEIIKHNTTLYPNISITMAADREINWYVSNAIDGDRGHHTGQSIHFVVGNTTVFIYTDINDQQCKTIAIHPITEEYIDPTSTTTTSIYPTTTTLYPETTTTTEYPTTTSTSTTTEYPTTTTTEYPTTTTTELITTITTEPVTTTTTEYPYYIEITDDYVKISQHLLRDRRGRFEL